MHQKNIYAPITKDITSDLIAYFNKFQIASNKSEKKENNYPYYNFIYNFALNYPFFEEKGYIHPKKVYINVEIINIYNKLTTSKINIDIIDVKLTFYYSFTEVDTYYNNNYKIKFVDEVNNFLKRLKLFNSLTGAEYLTVRISTQIKNIAIQPKLFNFIKSSALSTFIIEGEDATDRYCVSVIVQLEHVINNKNYLDTTFAIYETDPVDSINGGVNAVNGSIKKE